MILAWASPFNYATLMYTQFTDLWLAALARSRCLLGYTGYNASTYIRGGCKIWKRRGAVASGARFQHFFGQFRGLFKEFWAERGERTPPAHPPLDPRLYI